METAAQLYLTGGIGALTISALKEKTQASVGSIYYHFESKESLLEVLYKEALSDYRAGLDEALKTEDLRLWIRALIHHHLHWAVENPDFARLLHRARHDLGEARKEVGQETKQFVGKYWDWLSQKPELAIKDPVLVHALLLGPVHELTRHHLFRRPLGDTEKAAEALAAAAERSLLKSPANG